MLPPLLVVLSVCFMGAGALVPVMYLAVHGQASLAWVFGAAIGGTVLTDVFWISLARTLGAERIEHFWIVRKNPERLRVVGAAVKKHGAKILFWSKFVHGTGIASQIAAGIFGMSRWKAFFANVAGACAWTFTVFFLARSIGSLSLLEKHVVDVKIGFLIFVAAFIFLNFFGTRILRREFSLFEKK